MVENDIKLYFSYIIKSPLVTLLFPLEDSIAWKRESL